MNYYIILKRLEMDKLFMQNMKKKSISKFAMQALHFMAQPIITTFREELKHHIIVTIMANCNSNQPYIVHICHNRFMTFF